MVTINESSRYTAGKATQARQVTKNLPFLLGSLVVVLVVGLVGFTNQVVQRDVTTTSIDSSADNKVIVEATYVRPGDNKPSIYQFDVVSQDLSPLGNQEYTRKIPVIWNQIWEAAGWKPVKLMVSRYEADPKYRDIVSLLETISMPQRRHVYKYLAMSDNGGGWLAHSDTFPLHPFGSYLSLPNNGKLTLYDKNYPCLISGNASEWLRMGEIVAEHAHSFMSAGNNTGEWTEMQALKQMGSDENVILHRSEVFEKDADVSKPTEDNSQWSWNTQDCQLTKEKRAVHFRLGEKEDLAGMYQPGDMVIKWISMWLRICERSNYFINLESLKVEAGEPAVVKVGSFHAPENYNETRAAVVGSTTTNINLSTLDFGGGANNENTTTTSSEGGETPPVVTGTFHVDESYDENRTQHKFRTLVQAGDYGTGGKSSHS